MAALAWSVELLAAAGFYAVLAALFYYLARSGPPSILVRTQGKEQKVATALVWLGFFFAVLSAFTLGLGAGN